MANKKATEKWVKGLDPELTGNIGRLPTEEERKAWAEASENNKMGLMAAKIRYLRSKLESHMLAYLELRQSCGYIEGVAVPNWLFRAGSG
jgi:hypothetical protein